MERHEHPLYRTHVVMTQAEWDAGTERGRPYNDALLIDAAVRDTIARFTGITVYIDTCPCDAAL